MKFSPASAGFGALLLVSLGIKAEFNVLPRPPDSRLFAGQAAVLLRRQGFRVAMEPRSFGTIVHGTRGACHLIIVDYTLSGTFADRISAAAAPVGPLRFGYDGHFQDSPPRVRALIDFYVGREVRRIGLESARHPIVAVAAAPACAPAPSQWREFTRLQD